VAQEPDLVSRRERRTKGCVWPVKRIKIGEVKGKQERNSFVRFGWGNSAVASYFGDSEIISAAAKRHQFVESLAEEVVLLVENKSQKKKRVVSFVIYSVRLRDPTCTAEFFT
jgi:hypothetical protein